MTAATVAIFAEKQQRSNSTKVEVSATFADEHQEMVERQHIPVSK